jgi:hypothetical protein
MKRLLSIPLILLLTFSGISVTLAKHYCGGYLASTRLSLTGELATCGMEGEGLIHHSSGINLKTHCCDDVVTSIGIFNNYVPSYSFVPELFQHKIQGFSTPDSQTFFPFEILLSTYTNVIPPGALKSTKVDLSDICVFRI